MRVAIISDLHDNLTNLEKFLSWAKNHQVKKLLILGDTGSTATIKVIAANFTRPIFLILGNADYPNVNLLKKFTHLKIYHNLAKLNIAHKKIVLTHHPKDAKNLAATNQYNFIFYGHNHKPWIEQINKTILANPGTLAGMFTKATFAVWDTTTNKLELKILELI
ncbi:MAG TPA: YfcE family phosphodiesterase [bacterium]|nr:YfcE family phosphodiesterase [bacterium]